MGAVGVEGGGGNQGLFFKEGMFVRSQENLTCGWATGLLCTILKYDSPFFLRRLIATHSPVEADRIEINFVNFSLFIRSIYYFKRKK